jgi:hypothetical protein
MKLKICLFTLVCLQAKLIGSDNQAAGTLNVNSNVNFWDKPRSTQAEEYEAMLKTTSKKTKNEMLIELLRFLPKKL